MITLSLIILAITALTTSIPTAPKLSTSADILLRSPNLTKREEKWTFDLSYTENCKCDSAISCYSPTYTNSVRLGKLHLPSETMDMKAQSDIDNGKSAFFSLPDHTGYSGEIRAGPLGRQGWIHMHVMGCYCHAGDAAPRHGDGCACELKSGQGSLNSYKPMGCGGTTGRLYLLQRLFAWDAIDRPLRRFHYFLNPLLGELSF
ncbi:hypothetical protein P280DRAFT_484828 [Massarina eburnea CBS 473.64]|uniref:Uncharacterized protein n=1 Tax=Massarina eburnea CBS 473.64 TaxID=1395130 RepID=A0A6A6RIX1_9PLEO|nr:hypothetical protein P280DRAFT_484828 [Massarina eburnea CBS 473.64]